MINHYARSLIERLEETEVHKFLVEALQNLEYRVKNVHAADPRHEDGADLIAERAAGNLLVAVKAKPAKSDIDQLSRLSLRSREGELLYVYLRSPTEPFRKAMKDFEENVSFLGPGELHSFLVRGESTEYLQRLFGMHLLVFEFSDAVSILWSCRTVSGRAVRRSREDLKTLWKLKDAALKLRASIGSMATRWDEDLLSRVSWQSEEFEPLLERLLAELDQIQRFCGGSLASAFLEAKATRPHILASLWSIMRERTYWNEFLGIAERLQNQQQVAEFARGFWALPGAGKIGHTRFVKPEMKGFYSALAGLLRNLARAMKDLDDGIDMLWSSLA